VCGTDLDGGLRAKVKGNLGEDGWCTGLQEGLGLAGETVAALAAVTAPSAISAFAAVAGIASAIEGDTGAGAESPCAPLSAGTAGTASTRLACREVALYPCAACAITHEYSCETAPAAGAAFTPLAALPATAATPTAGANGGAVWRNDIRAATTSPPATTATTMRPILSGLSAAAWPPKAFYDLTRGSIGATLPRKAVLPILAISTTGRRHTR
jgi:hypothetical protein